MLYDALDTAIYVTRPDLDPSLSLAAPSVGHQ